MSTKQVMWFTNPITNNLISLRNEETGKWVVTEHEARTSRREFSSYSEACDCYLKLISSSLRRS